MMKIQSDLKSASKKFEAYYLLKKERGKVQMVRDFKALFNLI